MSLFQLEHHFKPAGDQPDAIAALVKGVNDGAQDQVLLGVTGSGKTFTMAHVIAATNRPALVMAPNKILAAQLYGELKTFFPHNAVSYFVSYYDYYQPEAYVPRTDTFIEKEASINEEIDRLRHHATRSLLEQKDVIVVASVSCIYGIGSVAAYGKMVLDIAQGATLSRDHCIDALVALQYKRCDRHLVRGTFRVRGDVIDIFPSHYDDHLWRIQLFGDDVEEIWEIESLTNNRIQPLKTVRVYANSHYVTPRPTLKQAIKSISVELKERLAYFDAHEKLVESQRLRQRITFDLEMMETVGHCNGIENYSRYLTGRGPGKPPPTLFEYLPKNALLFVDESHVSIPQIGAMYKGDAVRKATLSDYGFRLPSCKDNRPLTFTEWETQRPQTIHLSATPGTWELEKTGGAFIQQIIRPTGLLDPICSVRPTHNQVDDLMATCREIVAKKQRVLVTTLTKKMAEALTEYLVESGLQVRYLHSDVATLDRITLIEDLRRGDFDILVGINLLREGLDIPECSLVAILDADKEGFLRSKRSLIQTIGRAARHVSGHVILYADKITDSMKEALDETSRRRTRQMDYNTENGITPLGIQKSLGTILSGGANAAAALSASAKSPSAKIALPKTAAGLQAMRKKLEQEMFDAADALSFEKAAILRDQIKELDLAKMAL